MSSRRKATLLELQSLIGLLNFACAAVVAGRTFLRLLINLTIGMSNPLHFRRLNNEARADIETWSLFINNFNGKAFILPQDFISSDSMQMFTDASDIGMDGCLGTKWFCHAFTTDFLSFHITVRELLPTVIAVEVWHNVLQNKRIQFFCDSMSVVHIINKHTSKDQTLMKLMRRFMVSVLKYNI